MHPDFNLFDLVPIWMPQTGSSPMPPMTGLITSRSTAAGTAWAVKPALVAGLLVSTDLTAYDTHLAVTAVDGGGGGQCAGLPLGMAAALLLAGLAERAGRASCVLRHPTGE